MTNESGAFGAVEMLSKSSWLEQLETLPTASVAVAVQVLVVFVVAVTEKPGDAKAAAVPVLIGEPLQLAPL